MEKPEKKKKIEVDMGGNLGELLAEAVNKSQGEEVAFFITDDTVSVTDWVSTGNDLVDLSIANRPNGGIPVGKMTEITGLEGSGKSLMSIFIMKETQKKGGMAVLVDTEDAYDYDFVRALGIDTSPNKFTILKLHTVEAVFNEMETCINVARKSSKNRLLTIVIDSVAAASTDKEMASEHGQEGYATGKAIIISKALRKITGMIASQRVCVVFTNQLRQKVGVMMPGMDPWTTSGGKAIAFHSSVRLRLKSLNKLKNADKNVIGINTKCTVVKNRLGPPLRSVEFNMFYDRGIDNYGTWLQKLLDWDIITNAKKEKPLPGEKKKSKKEQEEEKAADKKAKELQFIMTVEGKEPETIKFERKDFVKTITVDRPECKEYLYKTLCNMYIMKYATPTGNDAVDIEVDEDDGEGLED
jgi:recombination protein RecA